MCLASLTGFVDGLMAPSRSNLTSEDIERRSLDLIDGSVCDAMGDLSMFNPDRLTDVLHF